MNLLLQAGRHTASVIQAHAGSLYHFNGLVKGLGMKTYKEKLQHPLWQKKRLEILNRDGFACRMCGGDEKMLHVHHLFYRKDADPWDYPNTSLITLCASCHEIEHEEYGDAKSILINSFRELGATHSDLISLAVSIDLAGCNDIQLQENDWQSLASIIGNCLKVRSLTGTLELIDVFMKKAVVDIKNA